MSIRQKIESYVDDFAVAKQKIYIIPTKIGFVFTGIMFTIFLIGLSYGNNLTLSVAFILFTYFVIQMLITHKNLGLINLNAASFSNNYSSTDGYCTLNLTDPVPDDFYSVSLIKGQDIPLKARGFTLTGSFRSNRGKFEGERIKLSNTGEAGLFYAWKYFNINYLFYVYPSPASIDTKKYFSTIETTESNLNSEFSHHIPYRHGLSSKRLDWKVFAKTDQLYWKQFSGVEYKDIELNFTHMPGSAERKLSHLAYLLDSVHKNGFTWTLILPYETYRNCYGYNDYIKSLEILAEAKV